MPISFLSPRWLHAGWLKPWLSMLWFIITLFFVLWCIHFDFPRVPTKHSRINLWLYFTIHYVLSFGLISFNELSLRGKRIICFYEIGHGIIYIMNRLYPQSSSRNSNWSGCNKNLILIFIFINWNFRCLSHPLLNWKP